MYEICPDCRKQVASWEHYCPHCGGELRKKAAAGPRKAAQKGVKSGSAADKLLTFLKLQ
ncbi:MAG: hypothetical protein HPY71_04460 [Firmicutes bacterium]|nr:hypothetical protein [Bacillota bacterium]